MNTNTKVDFFLDSGAFSAWSQGSYIDIQKYIKFIKDHEDIISVYANLDVIGNAKETWRNQRIMEKAGLNPIPVFHYGENIKWLKRYLNRGHEYIALGGLVGGTYQQLLQWLDPIWCNYLCYEDCLPKIKAHGFGLTSINLLLRYPWYSVDSSSWAAISRMGAVLIPKLKNNKWDFGDIPWQVGVTSRSPLRQDKLKHYKNLSPILKRNVESYIKEKGYTIGKSEFINVSSDYKVKQEAETWFKKNKIIERVIEPGISNNHRLRNELNILYFQDTANAMPKWPWKFKYKKSRKFF